MDSNCICWKLATVWATHVTQINPPGIDPIKVEMEDPILEDVTEGQRKEVPGLWFGSVEPDCKPRFCCLHIGKPHGVAYPCDRDLGPQPHA